MTATSVTGSTVFIMTTARLILFGNEYNQIGATSLRVNDKSDLELSQNETANNKQSHERVSAQLQAHRYLCKFHLQLCAIQSQISNHQDAYQSGQQAAAIAEGILLKTNETCESLVEEIIAKDAKFSQMLDQISNQVGKN